MKYIITDHNKIVLASGTLHHRMAQCVTGEVISAGHFEIKDGRVEVSGKSEGFGIESKPEDARAIEKYLGIN